MVRPKINSGISAYLQGGLGNQLFIYAAGLEQAMRLRCPLFIDTSFYVGQLDNPSINVTPRNFELDELSLPGTVIDSDSPWFRSSPLSKKRVLVNKFLRPSVGIFVETSSQFDLAIDSVRTGTTLVGYFQSVQYIKSAEVVVLEALKAQFVHQVLTPNLNMENVPSVSFHIRRGDYLDASRNPGQVITSNTYLERAITRVRDEYGNFEGHVFTDSPELVQDAISEYPELKLIDSTTMSPLQLLCNIANSSGIVLSNSSLSWWAARLMEYMNPNSLVIAPRPWHGNGKPDEMYRESWLVYDQN